MRMMSATKLILGMVISAQAFAKAKTPVPKTEITTASDSLKALERDVWISPDSKLLDLENQVARLIQTDPHKAFPFYLMSHLHIRKFGQSTENLAAIKTAADLAQQAVDLEPKSEVGYVALAETLDVMGQTDRALQLLSASSTLNVEPSWRYYFSLARLSAQKAEHKQIIGYLQQALAFKDSEPEVIVPYIIAVLQNDLSNDDLLQQLYGWQQRFPHSLFKQSIAMALADNGQYEKAHIMYQSVYKADNSDLEAKINDAIILYRNLAKTNEAQKLFESVLNADAQKPSLSNDMLALVRGHFATTLLKTSKYADAERQMLSALKTAPDQNAMLEFAIQAFRTNKLSKRLPDFIKQLTLEIKPSGLLYALLAESFSEDLAQHEKAIKSFADAILLEPTRSDYYNGMGLAYFRLSQWQDALELFQEASRVDPTDANAAYNTACAFARLGREKESLGALQEAISLNPELAMFAMKDADFRELAKTSAFKQIIADSKTPRLDMDGDELIPAH